MLPIWYHYGYGEVMAMTLRLPAELDAKVKQQAKIERISAQALLTKAAEEYVMRHGLNADIDDAMAEITVTFADALRRLGE
jgi:predicted transcriptional regulator